MSVCKPCVLMLKDTAKALVELDVCDVYAARYGSL